MDTLQLTRLLTADRCTRGIFKGVFPCDRLPKKKELQRPAALVVNTDPHDRPGEHWLALYLPEDNTVEFFDSYGHPPDHPRFPKAIVEFLRKCAPVTVFQPRQVQSSDAVTCGHHCVFFLRQRCKGLTYKQIQELYFNDLAKNDRMVTQFVKRAGYMPRLAPRFFYIQPQTCISCNNFHSCAI